MRVHLIGICGVSMRWIAEVLRLRGCEVTGSDITLGGHDAALVRGADLVIYTSAVGEDNPELAEARALGIPVLTRAQALGRISAGIGPLIAVAGTHGKSTVTGMTAYALRGYEPAVHVGGTIGGRTGACSGRLLVAEACEYRRNFLELSPDIAVVLNVELDHTDCYSSYGDMLSAFAAFCARSSVIIVPDGLPLSPKTGGRTVRVGRTGDYALIGCRGDRDGSELTVKTPDGVFPFRISRIGRHNALNAVFAVAAAREYGADYGEIEKGLAAFPGIDRRMQRVGILGGAAVFSDYAHHPTEIRAGLDALASAGYKSPLVVFQPHTHERLTSLMPDFASALAGVRSVLLPVFEARGGRGGADSRDLAAAVTALGGDTVAADGFCEAASLVLSRLGESDAIVVMGAGDDEKILPLLSGG
ncbi:MAG TPA: hypothetical protein H9693_07510 [Firmicutes bacterium]|nr:hypothetical protein [Bacillota bacterium]